MTAAAAALLLLGACGTEDYTRYVNPFVGTAYTGHTFPCAAYPLGMVQPGPMTGNFGWEYCSGYYYDDELMWGFTQDRLNGTGCPDMGDIMVMPFSKAERDDFKSVIDKETEIAVPGYYAVTLPQNGVRTEVTCTPHVAMYRFSFDGGRNVLVDFQSLQTSSEHGYDTAVLENEVEFTDGYTITGHSRLRGWVERDLYYTVTFDSPVEKAELQETNPLHKAPKYILRFADGDRLMMKIALSCVDKEGSASNLAAELPAWDFDAVRKAAHDAWNAKLSLFDVKGTDEQKSNFYTSVYHLFIQPNNIADADGRYRGDDNAVKTAPDGKYYSTLSLWDTFRAAHPLYTLVDPQLNKDVAEGMIEHCRTKGFLPIWELWGKENFCMIANHGVPVVADAALKGLVDAEKAYEAIYASLTVNHYRADWDVYDKYGYFPFDIYKEESASRTLECGYDDYCAAMLAGKLGKEEDRDFFMKRSRYYRNLFDPENKLIRARDSKGEWRTPFDKFILSHGGTVGGDYTEGNAWQYTWHIQQDVDGMAGLMGGRDAFLAKLDSLFILETRVDQGGFTGDVTGLIGQYAHGNEPSHHVIWLYSLLGDRNRTAELQREIHDKFYQNRPDGLCGNDDCGQMSAWYIFSALGFYPVNTVSGEYVLGAPQVPEAVVKMPCGKLHMKTRNWSEKAVYVSEVRFNGEPLGNTVSYGQLAGGGELEFVMSETK